ncbi:TetR family transcriptional regulator [Kribbella amoyensis]|uniref:TetR family transcriptional regulator n=1 Tax=Kribbella amoyensis TaxID=996641 RepID=A0A561BNM7_9ACTN|nr:TetR/AcrR family transcriptional regulator [Kribbella amoyensis]TWD80486.1 TetR family transcriptional regulator [Kribbella amoyensis]
MPLTRAEAQALTRARLLSAAQAEFTEHGYDTAKIDRIAARADLTRGAVYSNFPSKRALYYAALAEAADSPGRARRASPVGGGPAEVVRGFATAWLDRPISRWDRLSADLVPQLVGDGDTRTQYAQLLELSAILLALALEDAGASGRRVRLAKLVLATLHGADQLVTAAPGFVQPLDVIRSCEELADLDLPDQWQPPPATPPVRPANEVFVPPPGVMPDGLFVVLGLNRLTAVEDAVRSAPPGTPVTIALVSERPAELGPLTRLVVQRTASCLQQAVCGPRLPHLIHDGGGVLADALSIEVIANNLEYAAHAVDGRIVIRAEGFGATYAITRSADAVPERPLGPTLRR